MLWALFALLSPKRGIDHPARNCHVGTRSKIGPRCCLWVVCVRAHAMRSKLPTAAVIAAMIILWAAIMLAGLFL
jgi:hypothetical protein